MDHQEWEDLLKRALSGETAALCDLIDRLTPVIQKRVARVLLSRGAASGRNVGQEVADFTQEVFLYLFAKSSRVLRTWKPIVGLSLPNFVGFVAERRVRCLLRPHKNDPFFEDPTPTEELDRPSDGASPARTVLARDTLRRLYDRLKEILRPLGRYMYELLFLREMTPEEVAGMTGMSLAAVYKWHSRLRKLICRIRDEMSNPDGKPLR